MIRLAFVTVTDEPIFPGTLATVNSVLEFHPEADIFVVSNHREPLTLPQLECLQGFERVHVIDSRKLDAPERHIEAYALKAYACHDLCAGYDVIAGMDSGCVLCSDVSDVVQRCHERGGFLAGRDSDGVSMSTSLYFCAVNARNRAALVRWGNGSYPRTGDIELLDNRLWSQHRTYWDSVIHFREGSFFNVSAYGQRQRSFHCEGSQKFWLYEHRDFVLDGHELQMYPYIWFLTMLWFGPCGNWKMDPHQYLPSASHHLFHDLIHFLPQIIQVYPRARERWNALSDAMINRALDGIPRMLSLEGGSMSEVIGLVATHPGTRRYVEIGGYEGGSVLTLGLRFLNRDIDFYSVESFMGNLSGTVDGQPLPSRRKFSEHLARFPGLRVNLVPGDSQLAAALFEDASVDCVFIDACHDTLAVLRDIDVWLPKIRPGGIIAGDDYGWDSVRTAVNQRFPSANVTPIGWVWWVTL